MKTMTRTAAGILTGALLLAGCGSSDSGASDTTTTKAESTTTAPDSLEITDVWARQSPMGTSAGAIYLTITSPIDDELVGASVPTDVAGTTEIHETVMAEAGEMGDGEAEMGEEASTTTEAMDDTATTMAGGMENGGESMTMQPVDSIELPAGETVALEPGGYHVMLLDLVEPLEVGQEIELTLSFQVAGDRTVTAEVREG
jgi:copper(I)-binding protein